MFAFLNEWSKKNEFLIDDSLRKLVLLQAFVWFEEQTTSTLFLCHNGNFGKQTKAKIDRFLSAVHGGTNSHIPGWLFQAIEQKAFCSFGAETKTAFK